MNRCYFSPSFYLFSDKTIEEVCVAHAETSFYVVLIPLYLITSALARFPCPTDPLSIFSVEVFTRLTFDAITQVMPELFDSFAGYDEYVNNDIMAVTHQCLFQ